MRRIICLIIIVAVVLTSGLALAAKKAEWATHDPLLVDAKFVNDRSECLECHKKYINAFEGTKHAKVFKVKGSGDCETCHGPASKHLDKYSKELPELQKTESPLIFSFKSKSVPSEQKSRVCIQCHEKGLRMEWKGGSHNTNGVTCNSCHYVMERRSDENLFVNEDSKKACFACHSERRAQLQRSSHMPLREGKMDCASCHNPHGSAGPKMLKTATVNETCYQCHAEKRGPFVWEHAPVNENCAACHDPHGSNNPKLLVSQGSFLCTKCHTYGGHSSLLNQQTISANISGGCVNCHSRIHGSNHPSGARFQR